MVVLNFYLIIVTLLWRLCIKCVRVGEALLDNLIFMMSVYLYVREEEGIIVDCVC